MNLVKLSALLVAGSLTTGCISLFEEQKQQTQVNNRASGLVIPEGLNNPLLSEEYKLAQGDKTKYSEILAPTSVLVMLEGSWVNEDDAHPAKIMVEKPALVKNFPEFIDQGVNSYFKNNGISATKTDTGYKVTKDYSKEVGFWFWSSDVDVEQLDFDLTIDMQPHGRSGQVYIDVIDYKALNKSLAPDMSPAQRSSELATQTLNDIMLEVDYLYRIKLKDQRESIDVSLQLVKNIAGNHVITSQQDIRYVWSQVEDIIEELGFDVQEEDEELYVYETVFEKSGNSSWNIFDSGISNKVDIEEGEYEVALSTSTTGVDISFRAKNGGYLTQAQMENLFKLFLQVAKEEDAEL